MVKSQGLSERKVVDCGKVGEAWDGFYNYFVIISLLILLAKFNIAYLYQINWDEFYFLSKVHDYLRGDLGQVLQTFHVHFFWWLPSISINEASQVVAARFVMVVFQALTAFFLFRVARKFFLKSSSFFVVIIYFSINNVLLLGGDFRVDPIATCLLMLSLDMTLSFSRGYASSVAIGVLVSLSMLFTIKSAFFLPTIGLVFLAGVFSNTGHKLGVRQLFVVIVSAAVTFFAFYLMHKASFEVVSQESKGVIINSFKKTITSQNFFPRWLYFVESVKKDIIFWVFIAVGFFFLIKETISPKEFSRDKCIQLLAMLLPALTLLFYRNAFPYYYSFSLATTALLAAILWEKMLMLKNNMGVGVNRLVLVLLAGIILYTGAVIPFNKNMHGQKEMLSVIHKLFPEPVDYIDRCSMVSSYMKKGFFMSTWGAENYREDHVPIFENIVAESQPKFVLANKAQLDLAVPSQIRKQFIPERYDLFAEDLQVLRDNYIPHWGKLYVAGKYIIVDTPEIRKEFSVMIEGIYTLEAKSSVYLNGKKLEMNEVVFLEKGTHILKVDEKGIYTFRWGDNLEIPTFTLGSGSLFDGF